MHWIDSLEQLAPVLNIVLNFFPSTVRGCYPSPIQLLSIWFIWHVHSHITWYFVFTATLSAAAAGSAHRDSVRTIQQFILFPSLFQGHVGWFAQSALWRDWLALGSSRLKGPRGPTSHWHGWFQPTEFMIVWYYLLTCYSISILFGRCRRRASVWYFWRSTVDIHHWSAAYWLPRLASTVSFLWLAFLWLAFLPFASRIFCNLWSIMLQQFLNNVFVRDQCNGIHERDVEFAFGVAFIDIDAGFKESIDNSETIAFLSGWGGGKEGCTLFWESLRARWGWCGGVGIAGRHQGDLSCRLPAEGCQYKMDHSRDSSWGSSWWGCHSRHLSYSHPHSYQIWTFLSARSLTSSDILAMPAHQYSAKDHPHSSHTARCRVSHSPLTRSSGSYYRTYASETRTRG